MPDIHQRTAYKAGLFRDVFDNEQGQKVLAMLEDELNPDDIFNLDPNTTAYTLGRRDALVYIKQLINYRPKEEWI